MVAGRKAKVIGYWFLEAGIQKKAADPLPGRQAVHQLSTINDLNHLNHLNHQNDFNELNKHNQLNQLNRSCSTYSFSSNFLFGSVCATCASTRAGR
jgi:hypothetical protein